MSCTAPKKCASACERGGRAVPVTASAFVTALVAAAVFVALAGYLDFLRGENPFLLLIGELLVGAIHRFYIENHSRSMNYAHKQLLIS